MTDLLRLRARHLPGGGVLISGTAPPFTLLAPPDYSAWACSEILCAALGTTQWALTAEDAS